MATFQSKTWVDTIAEYPTRYKIQHSDLTEEQVTMINDFGTVSVSGDVFDADTFNNLESRIDAGFDSCVENLSGTTDPTGSQGKDGDMYIKTETVENVTSVVGLFVKVAGSWLPIQTGGATLPQAEGSGF